MPRRERLPGPRWALIWISLAPVLAVLVSVAFNVAYGTVYIEPLLTPHQNAALRQAILHFNALAFPPVALIWGWLVFSLAPALRADAAAAQDVLRRARARAINLPWHFSALIVLANLACLPVFLAAVRGTAEPLHDDFPLHLAVAVFIAAMITITIAFFLVELLVQALVLPRLFPRGAAAIAPGAISLSLGLRGLLLSLAAGVGPVAMLLLLGWVEDDQRGSINHFRLAVGALGVLFGLVSAWLLGRVVLPPVRALQAAARAVSRGRLDAEIGLVRADEFGTLIEEFNRMLRELRDKQRLRETFGLHVGERAAQQILARDPGLGGQLREVTVLFCDIRGFTAFSAERAPADVVGQLNAFLGVAVEIIEQRHGGMINKFLGDGFMALFGATDGQTGHAAAAVTAARDLLAAPLAFRVGVGIHSGPAIVGTIGSPHRLEYTAIGETVNLAARLEGLTKVLGCPLLFSGTTRERLPAELPERALGRHELRGQPAPVAVFTLAAD
ncbi:MAG TPA: adenylate/guanylate cyclase domain-containing protein [Nevskiales bacterium]|nr:adenylate/guanylate cyclase domain-containing protein [Nevskiales bacterium]